MADISLNRSIAANAVGRAWSVVAIYLFIPFYVRLLGMEAYAVINLQAVLFALLFFAEGGLAAAVTREMARFEDTAYRASVLATVERVYVFICAAVGLTVVAASGLIAKYWLNADELPIADLTMYLRIIGVTVGCQMAITLYHGVMMGLQRQVAANVFYVGFGVVRSALVLIPLLVSPSLEVFLLWQAGATAIYVFAIRTWAWRLISPRKRPAFDSAVLQQIAGFSLGMLSISVISALNNQVDKLLTSKFLPLADFGHYALASMLAQGPTIVALPIALAVLPRLTRAAESADPAIVDDYLRYSFVIASLATSVGLVIFIFAPDLLNLWVGESTSPSSATVTRLLVVGGVMLAIQLMPYHLALAYGHSRTNVLLGVASLLVTVPLLLWLVQAYGMIGAAMPWVVTNGIAMVVLGVLLTRRFLPGHLASWAISNTFLPCAACVAVAFFVAMIRTAFSGPWHSMILAVTGGASMLAACAVLYLYLERNRVRRAVRSA